MMASQIIAELQRLSTEFGDLQVRIGPSLAKAPLPAARCFFVEEHDGPMNTYFQIEAAESEAS